jgi:hypothetical protein
MKPIKITIKTWYKGGPEKEWFAVMSTRTNGVNMEVLEAGKTEEAARNAIFAALGGAMLDCFRED